MSRRHENTRALLQKANDNLGHWIARLDNDQLEFIEVLGRTGITTFRLANTKFGHKFILTWLEKVAWELRNG
jgi:hypothetical protein